MTVKEIDLESADASPATTPLEVIAPENLPEGYKFNVTIPGSNNIVAVIVPEGGVIAGQKFTTKIENLNMSNKDSSSNNQVKSMPNSGQWKDGLCNCFTHGCFHPMLWNSFCFSGLIALSQVMTRLKLNWKAMPAKTDKEAKRTFGIMVLIAVFIYFFNLVFNTMSPNKVTTTEPPPWNKWVRSIVGFVSFVYIVSTITKTRLYIRKKYSIKGSFCRDFCLSWWCTCCAVAQMARHTTDYDAYPGKCCTSTGLSRDTPSTIIDDHENNNVVIDSKVVDGAVSVDE